MRSQALFERLSCTLLALSAAACGGEDGTPESTGQGNPSLCGSVVADDMGGPLIRADTVNNYAFSSSFSIGVTPVAPSSELSFDWSGVTRDFLGHDVDPLADIDMVTLLLWKLSQEELEAKINSDSLAQRDMVALSMIYTEDSITSGTLFDFTSFRMPLDPEILLSYLDPAAYDPETHSYTVMAVNGTTAGKGTRMMQSFRLDPTSDNTSVVVDPSSTTLEYTANLSSLEPTQIPAGQAEIAIDWSAMTVNALGNEFVPTNIEEVLVAHYSLTPAEMEARFLDLDLIADQLWRGSVPSGTSTVLSSLSNEAGEPFAGIDDTGTWIVALVCGSCANPAPWYMSILKPCSAP